MKMAVVPPPPSCCPPHCDDATLPLKRWRPPLTPSLALWWCPVIQKPSRSDAGTVLSLSSAQVPPHPLWHVCQVNDPVLVCWVIRDLMEQTCLQLRPTLANSLPAGQLLTSDTSETNWDGKNHPAEPTTFYHPHIKRWINDCCLRVTEFWGGLLHSRS